MPSKSGHSRRERLARSKKKKGRRSPPVAVAQQPATAPTHETAASPRVSVPAAGTPSPGIVAAPAQYPYIASELRRIGILAGITLVILVILALTLS